MKKNDQKFSIQKSDLLFIGLFVLLITFRLWLITGIPKMLVYGPHDDLYFAKAAHYIIHGQWMGPYNQMTLIKGPFYAFFLILSFLSGLPLFLNESLFFIIACLLLFFALRPIIKNQWWRLLFFTILLFCPASLATPWNLRVYREFVYFSLTLYVIAFSIGLFLRVKEKSASLLFWSVGFGITMGAFLITREEGMWIYPILFCLWVFSILSIWKNDLQKKWFRTGILLLPVVIWLVPGTLISQINAHYYGFNGTAETLDPDFNRVINALGSIQSSTWHPSVQITKEARMKAYEASTLFRKLQGPIEDAMPIWNNFDDSTMNGKPAWYLSQYTNNGSEIGNGHFIWLLRDAVRNQGYYDNGKYPGGFYKQLADQLELACKNGTLSCSVSGNIPFLGSIDKQHVPIIMRFFFEDTVRLLKGDYERIADLDVRNWPKWDSYDDSYKFFNEFIYNSYDDQLLSSNHENVYLVNNKMDLRLKMIRLKQNLMEKIFAIYQFFTLPFFILAFAGWIVLAILSVFKKRIRTEYPYLVVSTFILGILVSRLLTLSIIDAATSVIGIYYGPSIYLGIYIFPLIVFYWIYVQLRNKLFSHF